MNRLLVTALTVLSVAPAAIGAPVAYLMSDHRSDEAAQNVELLRLSKTVIAADQSNDRILSHRLGNGLTCGTFERDGERYVFAMAMSGDRVESPAAHPYPQITDACAKAGAPIT